MGMVRMYHPGAMKYEALREAVEKAVNNKAGTK
jgi:hypothetical protein